MPRNAAPDVIASDRWCQASACTIPLPIAVDIIAQAAAGLHDAHEARSPAGEPVPLLEHEHHTDVATLREQLVDGGHQDGLVVVRVELAPHFEADDVRGGEPVPGAGLARGRLVSRVPRR